MTRTLRILWRRYAESLPAGQLQPRQRAFYAGAQAALEAVTLRVALDNEHKPTPAFVAVVDELYDEIKEALG